MALEIRRHQLVGFVDGKKVIEAEDLHKVLEGGGIGYVVSEGRVESGPLRITALGS